MKTLFLRFPLAVALLAAAPFLSSCNDDDDHDHDDENELITTVQLRLTPTSGTGQAVTAQWRDLDGDGGNAPTIEGLTLAANTTYTGTVILADDSKNPSVNITAEIEGEKNDHLFVYEPIPAGLLTVTRTDLDGRNLEVGLTTEVRTSTAASGFLKVTLRHQPNGSKNGTAAPGDTDAEVTFPVAIR